jgi:acid stress chaperone HdeB
MSRLGQAWLALSFSAAAVLPAHAQVTVEMTKITCEQYILFAMGDPKDIAMWMTGYYSAKRNNTTFDLQEFREASKKVMDYCAGGQAVDEVAVDGPTAVRPRCGCVRRLAPLNGRVTPWAGPQSAFLGATEAAAPR